VHGQDEALTRQAIGYSFRRRVFPRRRRQPNSQ